jgi:hypothetical protein
MTPEQLGALIGFAIVGATAAARRRYWRARKTMPAGSRRHLWIALGVGAVGVLIAAILMA